MKTITEEIKRKLLFVAQDMFEHLQGYKDYHYTTWEHQFRDLYQLYENGDLPDSDLDIVSEGYKEFYK